MRLLPRLLWRLSLQPWASHIKSWLHPGWNVAPESITDNHRLYFMRPPEHVRLGKNSKSLGGLQAQGGTFWMWPLKLKFLEYLDQ